MLLLLLSGITVNAQLQNCSHLQRSNGFQRHSQGDQDGILRDIFNTIGVTNRCAVEFGFGYHKNSNHTGEERLQHTILNTRLLREQGWKAIYFDALISDSEARIHKVILTEDNLVDSFRAAGVPAEVDYVSIDVDSIDIWLLRAMLKVYRPRVISVEYNRNFLSWMHITHVRKWHAWSRHSVYGASAGAINHVAHINGYVTVNIMPSGLDMFLIRNDTLQSHCLPHSIASFEELADAAAVGKRFHPTCHERYDLPRLVDLHLELQGDHKQAHLKAIKEVSLLNSLNPMNPMCNLTEITWERWTHRAPVDEERSRGDGRGVGHMSM